MLSDVIYGLGLAGIAVFKGCHSFSLLPASLEGDREVLGKSLARYGIEGPPLEALGVSEALAALGACAAGYEPGRCGEAVAARRAIVRCLAERGLTLEASPAYIGPRKTCCMYDCPRLIYYEIPLQANGPRRPLDPFKIGESADARQEHGASVKHGVAIARILGGYRAAGGRLGISRCVEGKA